MNTNNTPDHFPGAFEESSSIRRNLSGTIDAVLIVALYILMIYWFPGGFMSNPAGGLKPILYILLLLVLYRLIFILLFNGTIGMHLCQVKFLNEHHEPASASERSFAAFFLLINGVRYYNK